MQSQSMKPYELKVTFKTKCAEFESAMEEGKPHSELLKMYKELKELQYQMVQAQLAFRSLKTLYKKPSFVETREGKVLYFLNYRAQSNT
jgi:hypothetical protein